MKLKLAAALLAAAGILAAGTPALAQDVLKTKGCLNCHDVDKKKMGPSFKEAAKKGVKSDEIVAKMKEGKGHPKVAGSDAELKAAADKALASK